MSTTPQGPLAGYRVLEMGSTIAGPFCGRLFADFGAEVIKIEPREGDGVRSAGKRYKGKSLYAASILRNKKLISVDLRHAKGQELVRKLVPQCDVVIENFRPGGLEKWGLGYADLSRLRPDLVMVRISGFGQTGPYSSRPGYGIICEAASGLRHLTGDPDRPPARVAVALTDYITGLYAAFGAVMALLHRNRTGEGQYVDAALAEGAFSFIEPHIPAFDKLGEIANRAGSGIAGSVPNNLYATADGQFVHIQAAQNTVFLVHQQELDDIVADWAGKHALAEIRKTLDAVDVPAMGINNVADIFLDPHFRERGMLAEVPDDDLGTVTLTGVVPKLSRTPGHIRKSGGRVGQDTRSVLAQMGCTAAELQGLEEAGVIYSDPQGTAP